MEIPICMHHIILSVDDITDSLHSWLQIQLPGGFQWNICQVFTQNYFSSFVHNFCHEYHDAIQILPWNQISRIQCNILDISYVKHNGLSILYWLQSVFDTIYKSTKSNYYLHMIMLWNPLEYLPHHIHTSEISYVTANLPSSWDFKFLLFWAIDFGNTVDAQWFGIFISQTIVQWQLD